MNRDSSAIIPGATSIKPFPDLEERLMKFRDHHAAVVRAAMNMDPADYQVVEVHEPLCQMAADALETIRRLTEANKAMQITLRLRNV